jgi:hypothetical protein
MINCSFSLIQCRGFSSFKFSPRKLCLSICLHKQIFKMNFTIFLLGSCRFLPFLPKLSLCSDGKKRKRSEIIIYLERQQNSFLSVFRMILKIKFVYLSIYSTFTVFPIFLFFLLYNKPGQWCFSVLGLNENLFVVRFKG